MIKACTILFGTDVKSPFNYSQTGCSFPRNFATFRRDSGILIDSLVGAICNWRDQFATGVNKLRFSVPVGRWNSTGASEFSVRLISVVEK